MVTCRVCEVDYKVRQTGTVDAVQMYLNVLLKPRRGPTTVVVARLIHEMEDRGPGMNLKLESQSSHPFCFSVKTCGCEPEAITDVYEISYLIQPHHPGFHER